MMLRAPSANRWSVVGRRRRGRLASILLVAVLLIAVGRPGVAMTQVPTPPANRDVPAPAECRIEPRSLAFFERLADGATPAPTSPTPFNPPEGGRPDAATVDGITVTIRHLAACLNAGDTLRVDALYTDAYFYRQIADLGPPSPEFLATRGTPVPVEERRWAGIDGIREVRMLPDGRVSAVVELHIPPEDVTFAFVFVREGERWLIDGESVVSSSSFGGG